MSNYGKHTLEIEDDDDERVHMNLNTGLYNTLDTSECCKASIKVCWKC